MVGRLLLVVVLLLACARPVLAQGVAVSGTVVDETGARLPGATVTLSGGNTRETRFADAAGEYRFPFVPAGDYEVTAVLSGFAQGKRSGVTVGTAPVTVPEITLAMAGLGETVIVSASRQESTVLDAPATMTVIPASTLEALPSRVTPTCCGRFQA